MFLTISIEALRSNWSARWKQVTLMDLRSALMHGCDAVATSVSLVWGARTLTQPRLPPMTIQIETASTSR